MSKKPQTYFQKNWLQMPKFAQWLHDVKDDNTSAGCKICHKKIKLSIMGKLALGNHGKGSKHLIK